MSQTSTLTTLCRFTQALAGCNVINPAESTPVMLVVLVDAAGNVIPVDSESFSSVGTAFQGDGEPFIRSYYADMMMNPISDSSTVEFSTPCSVGDGGATGSLNLYVHKVYSYEGGRVILTFSDTEDGDSPEVTFSGGTVSVIWTETQTPHSARIRGGSGDLSSNSITLQTEGGKNIALHSQSDDQGLWPLIAYQNRTRIGGDGTIPFLQVPHDETDGVNILNMPITVPGRVSTRIDGISGDFGIVAQW